MTQSDASDAKVRPDSDAERRGPPSRRWRRLRILPLALAGAALAAGLWSGLARLGLALPLDAGDLAPWHGALMICGFLGTLISLERAVALARPWAYAAPAISALGAVGLFAGSPLAAAVAFLLASAVLTLVSCFILARQPALFTAMLVVAAACWGGGTLLWIVGADHAEVAGWWLAFLVLTIAAERLELSRLLAPPLRSQATFAAATAVLLVGIGRGELAGAHAPFTGLGLLAVTAWLLRHDIARRTVGRTGQARFSAICMLAGYFWLGCAGVLVLLLPPEAAAFSYDAAIHAVAIGFVISMIFAHAPIILPAVTGLRVQYTAALYGALTLLHASALARVAADVVGDVWWRSASGPLTILALVGYAAALAGASLGRTRPRSA